MHNLKNSHAIIGVVGAGAMGAGIAQIAAASGHKVLIFDQNENAAKSAYDITLMRLKDRMAEGKIPAETVDTIARNMTPVDSLTALAPCALVVEAIVEELEIKRGLFAQLVEIVTSDCVLASNTSSLPIGAIAQGLSAPERIAGLHFFNPVPVMKLVEVIRTPETSDAVIEGLVSLSKKMGQTPVEVGDTPGFLVNFGGRAYTTEGLALVHEGVATPSQVDAVMRDCCEFRMGPFELMDLTGIDVNYPVTTFVHQSYFSDPRLRSTPLHRYLFDIGQLGRKSGRGFYDYRDSASTPNADATPASLPPAAVWLPEPTAELEVLMREVGVTTLKADDHNAPILVAPLGEDCAALCARTGYDHRRVVALDLSCNVSKRITLMTAPGSDAGVLAQVTALFAPSRAVTIIADSPGFIAQRICAMVANLGCEMAQIGLARPHDIDTAMRLGLNYPKGPLELTDAMGPHRVFGIITQLQKLTGDDRYRPSQWLRRRAQLGLSALRA
jgi:3-hydroxybutyryl-CoA dehydrogenase